MSCEHIFFFLWRNSPTRARATSSFTLLDHTQWHTTVVRTPLDEGSARRSDLYLTTDNTHKRQTPMHPAGFEPAVRTSERPKTPYAAWGLGSAVNIIQDRFVVWLTPWSEVLPEKPTGSQLLKKFPVFDETQRFITVFTRANHLFLPCIRSIQFMPPSYFSISILILSSNLRLGLPSGLLPSGFPTKTLFALLLSRIRATCLAHLSLLDLICRMIFGEEYKA
jgi:hypothetical protein